MDILDVNCVIQFMVLDSLSILTQHFGRAGRSGQPALAILLAEPSVFQVIKRKMKANLTSTMPEAKHKIKAEPVNDEDVGLVLDTSALDNKYSVTETRKKTEVGLQNWCLTLECRGEVSDKYYNNPPRSTGNLVSFLSFEL
jgi:superfamily II DNA helicase RecQ